MILFNNKIIKTMRKIQIVLLLVFFVFNANILKAQDAIISGIITESTTQQPLYGANVYLEGTNIGTASNNKGVYELKKVNPGNYNIVISFSGFEMIRKNITLIKGENKIDFQMEESYLNLDEVVVTATGTAHDLKNVPVPTQLFNKNEVKAIAANEFSDLMLNLSPSFDFNPGVMGSFMSLNGLGNDFILVLIDGKRIYGDIGGNNDLNRINTDNIERIEIVKGASSLLYGSDAIAGVVNIITKQSKQKINITNVSRYRTYNTYQQNNTINLNFGKFSSNTSFSTKGTDGWQLNSFEDDGGELIKTDAKAQNTYSDISINQKISFAVTDKFDVYALGSYYEKDVIIPETVKRYGYFFDDITYGAGAKYLLNESDYISLDYNHDQYKYYYKYNQDYRTFTEGDKSINNDQTSDNVGLKYVNVFSDKNTLTMGVDFINEKMISETRLIDGIAKVQTTAFYAQDELLLFNNLNIVLGTRLVNHSEFGIAFTPKLSMMYKLKDFNIRGTYGFGYKAPTVKELYYNYEKRGTVFMGNTNLDPQTSTYLSGGVEYNYNKISISITAYINKVNDLIAYQSVDTIPGDQAQDIRRRRQHFNVDKARSQGADFLFNTRLAYGFSVGGGYSYVDARDMTTNERLEGVAYNYANVNLAYKHMWNKYILNANISGRIQDKKYYDDGSAKAYNIWKLTTSHQFVSIGDFVFEISAGIDNIFDFIDDSPYGSHYATISPGRTFFLGLNINFAK